MEKLSSERIVLMDFWNVIQLLKALDIGKSSAIYLSDPKIKGTNNYKDTSKFKLKRINSIFLDFR
jgi:hypothetical protein